MKVLERGHSESYVLHLSLSQFDSLHESVERVEAQRIITQFRIQQLAMGGKPEDIKAFIKPFIELAGGKAEKTGDDFVKKYGTGI